MSVTQTNPRVEDRNWSKLTIGEQTRMLEVEGYLVIPNLLTQEQIKDLKAQTATLQTRLLVSFDHGTSAAAYSLDSAGAPVLMETFTKPASQGATPGLRYRVAVGGFKETVQS